MQVGEKRKRDASEDAEQRAKALQTVRTFMQRVRELPANDAQPDILRAQVQGLREGLLAQVAENDALRALIGPAVQAAQ